MHLSSLISTLRRALAVLACRICGNTDGPFTADGRCEDCAGDGQ